MAIWVWICRNTLAVILSACLKSTTHATFCRFSLPGRLEWRMIVSAKFMEVNTAAQLLRFRRVALLRIYLYFFCSFAQLGLYAKPWCRRSSGLNALPCRSRHCADRRKYGIRQVTLASFGLDHNWSNWHGWQSHPTPGTFKPSILS